MEQFFDAERERPRGEGGTRSPRGRRPARGVSFLSGIFVALSFLLLTTSCVARTTSPQSASSPAIVKIVDEAFQALLPKAAAMLNELPNATEMPGTSIVTDLDRTIGKILEKWTQKSETMPKAVIASPIAAAKFAKAIAAAKGPDPTSLPLATPFVVPFAGGFALDAPYIHAVEYDFEAAYAAMGKKAAAYLLKASKKSGTEARCGLVFQENFMRGNRALESFVEAFRTEIGEGRLIVEVLDAKQLAVDPSGATEAAIRTLTGVPAAGEAGGEVGTGDSGGRAAVIVLAVDNAFVAEKAAAGSSGRAIFMADQSSWAEAQKPGPGLFRYRIRADEERLARAAMKVAKTMAGGGYAGEVTKVPLRYGPVFPKIF